MLFDNPEMNRIFIEQIHSQAKSHIMGIDEYMQMVGREEGIEIGIEKGREEGIEKGRQEERRAFVENLLSQTEFSDEKIAGLANVSVDFVNKIRMNMNSL
jgi:predicted transposase/invertase (TIGR01784 family)